jgi:heme-degrading monooxygenase HmoA
MIIRSWRARTIPGNADAFQETFRETVLPHLESIEGYQGYYLLRQDRDGTAEFLTLTLWDSLDAIRRFAGADTLTAVVSPAVAAIVLGHDTTVSHYTVVADAYRGHIAPA